MSWFFWINVNAEYIVWTGTLIEDKINNDSEEKLLFDWSNEPETIGLHSANDIEDKDKTIKELEEEKKQLISDKKIITNKFNAFILNNWDLRKYFKEDLSDEELQLIDNIIIWYNSRRSKSENLLREKAHQLEDTEIITNDLLRLKKDLYISFLPFIVISKIEEYKLFIKADFTATKKDKDIQSDIYKKEKIVEGKKIIIQEKIEASEQALEEKKNKVIEGKIKQKLTVYSESDKFTALSTVQKKFVFTAVLKKIITRRESLELSDNIHKDKKIKLYLLVENSISNFINNLK